MICTSVVDEAEIKIQMQPFWNMDATFLSMQQFAQLCLQQFWVKIFDYHVEDILMKLIVSHYDL